MGGGRYMFDSIPKHRWGTGHTIPSRQGRRLPGAPYLPALGWGTGRKPHYFVGVRANVNPGVLRVCGILWIFTAFDT